MRSPTRDVFVRHVSIRHGVMALAAALTLLAAACGDDDTSVPATGAEADQSGDESGGPASGDETDTGDEAAFPVTVTSNGVETTIDARPESIVVLSPTATEMLYAVGAGDQVEAVDDYSTYPEDAPVTDLSAYDPNLEAIIAHEPDLVVLSDDANDVVSGLEAVEVPTIVLGSAKTLDDTYTQIELLGAATGHVGEAAELVSQMQSDIEALVAEVPERDEPLTYFHELDDTLYSVTSETFIGEIYSLAGLENVADAADTAGDSGGYPQLSPEFLVDADPDLVFLADGQCCGQDPSTFAARPGFGGMRAVEAGNIIVLDEDIASRWGPRVVDFLEIVVEATADVEAPVG